MLAQKNVKLFVILAGFFIANALIAEVMGAKIFSLEQTLGWQPVNWRFFGETFSLNLTAGVILWPVVFIMTDIINEYYGQKGVRFLSYFTAALIAFSFIVFSLGIRVSPAGFWENSFTNQNVPSANAAYNTVLGQSQWIIIGSIAAFLLAQILDVTIFHRIKKITGEKNIWLRATGSTLASQLIDSFVVLFIAFYIGPKIVGSTPWKISMLLAVCLGNYIYKVIIAFLMTPVIYGVHYIIDQYLGKDLASKMKQDAMQV